MTLDQFRFVNVPGTFADPVNTALIDIVGKLYPVAVDLDEKPLLISASLGIDAVMADVISGAEPGPEACPCVRVLSGKDEYDIDTVDFLTLDGYTAVHLYFIHYALNTVNFELLRRDHVRRCLKYLQPSEQDINDDDGLDTDATVWEFSGRGSWKLTIDYDTPLRFFGQNIQTADGYFVTRVDLQIKVNDYQPANE